MGLHESLDRDCVEHVLLGEESVSTARVSRSSHSPVGRGRMASLQRAAGCSRHTPPKRMCQWRRLETELVTVSADMSLEMMAVAEQTR
jgi:hypothetical protein